MTTNWVKRFLIACSACLGVASFAPLTNAQLVSVPGTSISLDPPAGFSLSEQFSGFVNQDNLSSIIINELPLEGYAEIAKIFSSLETATVSFASQGIIVEDLSTVDLSGTQVPLIQGFQSIDGTRVGKYIALLRGETTILLVFNVIDNNLLDETAVLKAIESVKITATPSVEEQIAQLPFSFEIAPPFQVFQTLGGSGVIISPNGEPDPSGTKPVIIIASAIGSAIKTDNLAVLAEQIFRDTREFATASITEQKPIDFAGGEGYLIKAEVDDGKIYQYLRVPPDTSYLRLIVMGETEEIEKLTSSIQKIINSVELKDSN